MSWILQNVVGLVSVLCFDLTHAAAVGSAQTAVSDHTASRSFKSWGEDTQRSEKAALFLVDFFSLSEKARSDPVLWLICMQSKYCSSPDTVKSDWGTFHTWGCYGIGFLGRWVLCVTMRRRAEPCALHPLPPPLHGAVIVSVAQRKMPLSRGWGVWLPELLQRLF